MAQNDLDYGLAVWHHIAKTLNEIIQTSGPIQQDNRRIWNEIMDPLTDKEWESVMQALGQLNREYGEYVSLQDWNNLVSAAEQFDRYSGTLAGDAPGYSCMNYKPRGRKQTGPNTKQKTWPLIMTLREVWNKVCDLDIPNR